MEPLSPWESLSIALRQAEYVHVLLHPLPIYGMLMGVIALGLALLMRSRPAEIVGLVLVLLAALSVWPVMHYGDRAYDGMYGLISSVDREGGRWLEVHSERAVKVSWVFYSVATLAFISLLLPRWIPQAGRWLVGVTLLSALVAMGCGAWIGAAGGQAKHKEFRYAPPPEKQR